MQIQALIRITAHSTLRHQCFNQSITLLNCVLYGVAMMLVLVSYLLVKITKLQLKYGLFPYSLLAVEVSYGFLRSSFYPS